MKTDPGLLGPPLHPVVVLVLGMLLATASGCASKSNVAKQTPYPVPHVVDAGEIMQPDAVKARTRELMDSGEYKDSADARRAAQKEYPSEASSSDGTQEAESYRWKQQQAVQTKFEVDLEKMNRKS